MTKTKFILFHFFTVCLILQFGCNNSPNIGNQIAERIKSVEPGSTTFTGDSYIALRSSGAKQTEIWVSNKNWFKGLSKSINKVDKKLKSEDKNYELVEICLPIKKGSRIINHDEIDKLQMHYGVMGIKFEYKDKEMSFCPTQMLAEDINYKKAFNIFTETNSLHRGIIRSINFNMTLFDANQYIYLSGKKGELRKLFRGKTPLSDVYITKGNVEKFIDGMGMWLINNIQHDGRLIYEYNPVSGQESDEVSSIRLIMGTASAFIYSKYKEDQNIAKRVKLNLDYQLRNYYKEKNDYGYLTSTKGISLGGAALAGIAILNSPNPDEYRTEEQKLRNFTYMLQQDNGKFNVYYDLDSELNQNYFPGETLYYWSVILQNNKDHELEKRFMKSFEYYRKWHRNNRNSAFVPWHTQAYYNMWQLTKNDEFKDFIFEMNDWILTQKVYDDSRPDSIMYGHASGIGVLLEGMIDAYKLAMGVGDKNRMENYREFILAGLKSGMNLQFKNEIDAFYIKDKNKTLGGIHNTLNDKSIRVDNIQHNILAAIKIVETFSENDFKVKNKKPGNNSSGLLF
ncbi:MAG: hypothetical protein ACR2NW_10040 [Thermodesulfobacteriota bacterium]